MMHNLLERWRRVPYTLSVFIWLVGILLIGDRIGAPYFQSDFRLRFTLQKANWRRGGSFIVLDVPEELSEIHAPARRSIEN